MIKVAYLIAALADDDMPAKCFAEAKSEQLVRVCMYMCVCVFVCV